ncbi:MAG: lamin tail domain-containing protein [Gemmatimonadota bacterium]
MRSRTLAAVLVASLSLAPALSGQAPEYVQVSILDVGLGDLILVRTPGGEVVLVDGGPSDPLRYFQQMRIDSVAVSVVTDVSNAHVAGLFDVVTARPVGRLVHGGATRTSDGWTRLRAALGRLEGVRVTEVRERTVIEIDGIELELLPAPDALNGRGSLGVVMRYGSFSVLLTSYADPAVQRAWVRDGWVPDVTVMTAPRHGAARSLYRPLVTAANPEVGVVSGRGGPRDDVANPSTLTTLANRTDAILRTERDGHLTVLGYEDGSFELVIGSADPTSPVDPDVDEGPTLQEALAGASPFLALSVDPGVSPVGREALNAEHVTVRNSGPSTLRIDGWTLCDLSSRCFRFPPGSRVEAGAVVRVYSGYGHTDGYSFFMNETREVWNDNGDEATLRDAGGRVMARTVY